VYDPLMGRCAAGIVGVLLVGACGDNGTPPIPSGTYVADIDIHEKPCGTRVDPADVSDPFFVPMTGWTFDIVDYPDADYPFMYQCWGHSTEPCGALTVIAFDRPRLDGWDAIILDAYADEITKCTLAYGEMSLRPRANQMTFELTWYKQTGIASGPCTQDEAATRATSMPCYKHEHVEATLQ